MTKITGIAEVAIYVTNLARAKKFYTEVLGLPVTASFNEACFLQTGQNSTLILFDVEGIRQRTSAIPSHGAHGEGHVAFSVSADEMDAWRDRLVAKGVNIEHEQDWSQGTHSIYFRDPDNNSLEMIEASHYPGIWRTIEP